MNDRKSRQARLKVISGQYKHFCDEDSRHRCWYCGDPSDTLDHCPSVSAAYAYGPETLANNGIKLLLIPSCRECNNLLGDVAIFVPEQRGYFIYEMLNHRYRKTNKWKEFAEEEVRGGSFLEKFLKNSTTVKKAVERRLYLSSRFEVNPVVVEILISRNVLKRPSEQVA